MPSGAPAPSAIRGPTRTDNQPVMVSGRYGPVVSRAQTFPRARAQSIISKEFGALTRRAPLLGRKQRAGYCLKHRGPCLSASNQAVDAGLPLAARYAAVEYRRMHATYPGAAARRAAPGTEERAWVKERRP